MHGGINTSSRERGITLDNFVKNQTHEVDRTPNQPNSANEPTEAGTPMVIQSSNDESRKMSATDLLPQLCTLLSKMQQQLQLQREQDKRHEMMQLLLTLNVGDTASQNRHSTSATLFPKQNHQSLNLSQMPENFSSVSSRDVKFLSSQIPQFSGSEEDNVNLWLEKLESIVAEIYNFFNGVKLSATTSRLKQLDVSSTYVQILLIDSG